MGVGSRLTEPVGGGAASGPCTRGGTSVDDEAEWSTVGFWGLCGQPLLLTQQHLPCGPTNARASSSARRGPAPGWPIGMPIATTSTKPTTLAASTSSTMIEANSPLMVMPSHTIPAQLPRQTSAPRIRWEPSAVSARLLPGTAIERSHAMIPRSPEVGRMIVSACISPTWRGDRSGRRGLWKVTYARPRNRRTLLA